MPPARATAPPTIAARAAMMRSRVPDSTIMVAVTTTSTRATPRAGSITTRAISGAAQARASSTERRPGVPRHRAWLNTVAMTRTSATFANSDGSTWKPPGREIHACAPLMSEPMRGEHGQQAEHGRAVDERRPRPQLPGVDEAHREHQDQPDHDPQQLLLQVGARVRARREQGGLGGRPDEQDADRAQPAHHDDQQPVHLPQHGVPGERPGQQGPRAARERPGPRRAVAADGVARAGPAQHHGSLV